MDCGKKDKWRKIELGELLTEMHCKEQNTWQCDDLKYLRKYGSLPGKYVWFHGDENTNIVRIRHIAQDVGLLHLFDSHSRGNHVISPITETGVLCARWPSEVHLEMGYICLM